jgi:hypothetical protein
MSLPHDSDDPGVPLESWRLALALAAMALGAQTADLALHAYALVTADHGLFSLLSRPDYAWYIGTPITWGAAMASYALVALARPGRRRVSAVLLSTMNTFDVVLWLADHAAELRLTLPLDILRDPWLAQAARVFQWIEPMLFAGLAVDLLRELGRDEPRAAIAGVRSSATLGLLVWAFGFALRSGWMLGWFRHANRRVLAEIQLLGLFSIVLLAATTFQTTILCATAARRAARAARDRRRAELDHELLRPQPDPFVEEDRKRRRGPDPFGF